MRKRNRRNKQPICECCENLIPIGEGDHICGEGDEPKLVLDDYQPADDYGWGGGKFFREA